MSEVRAPSAAASGPRLLDSGGKAALIRRLEGFLPLLEQTGRKVGVGVAAGADEACIGGCEATDAGPSGKLPPAATGT
ncbi:MAG: hypothetical protein LBW85_00870 [Deltaproteobacteria bacterium]|nr:hypothetical protein [Deltaproteobacteria bacterium]